MTNLVGTTLGQYQIVELIGEGGMASVYKAWQPSLRRYVALKVLAPHLAGDAEFVQRFHQEAVSAANLKHSNIVTIHDVGTESGYQYIAMEFIEGASLEERIRSGQAFTLDQVVGVLSQVGSALDYAHQRGFIHRDIKPANVLIDESGRAVLTDFGIVKALSGSGVTSALTRAGTVFGTPHYMSPEQVRDEPLDHRSDLYSLGIVCYEMLAGQVPFNGTTTHAILYAQVNTPPPPLRETLGSAAPPHVEAVVDKILAKERDDRYNSAGEFSRDLAQAAAGVRPAGLSEEPVVPTAPLGTGTAVMPQTPSGIPAPTVVQPSQPPTPMPMAAPPPPRRRRWPLVLGALAVVAGVVLIVGAVLVLVVLPGDKNPLEWLGLVQSTEEMLSDAQSEMAAGNYDGAINIFKEVLDKEADNVEALKGLGQAHEAQEMWQHAGVWYEKWVQVEPDNPDALLALGWMEYKLEQYEGAVAQFNRAGGLAPDRPAVFLGLARAYLGLGDYANSLENIEQALQLAPDGSAEQDQAVQLLENLALADSDPEPLLVLSHWYASRGDQAALEQVNQRILEQISDSMDVNLGDQIRFLGYTIQDLSGDQVQVDLYFEPIADMDVDYGIWLHTRVHEEDVDLLPPDRREQGFIGGGFGTPRLTSQWSEGAIYRGSTVRELVPGDYRFLFGVWLSDPETRLATPDDPQGAVDLGWHLVGEDTEDAQVLIRHGWEKLESDELEEARQAFEAALAIEPDTPDGLLGASAVYGALGESGRLSEVNDRLLALVPDRQDVPLGDVIRFIGYDLQTLINGRVQLDLYFQATMPMDVDYVIWLHNRVRQEDIALLPPERQEQGFIGGGFPMEYPTSRWVEGAVYRATTVRDLAPGEYNFLFGVWLSDSGIRLPAPDDPEKGTVDLGWHGVGGE